ncbi:MAG TPA: hypothetical protein ENJ68_05725, partial [Devosia sp.]|nr:hypothetical protein [Devosia sp.]
MGTPPPKNSTGGTDQPINLVIDGRPVTAPAGTSVMRAAEIAGIAIPKLCA